MRPAERLFSLHAAEKAEQGRQGEKHMSWFDHRPARNVAQKLSHLALFANERQPPLTPTTRRGAPLYCQQRATKMSS